MKHLLIVFILFFSAPTLTKEFSYDIEPPKRIEKSYYYDSIHGKPVRESQPLYHPQRTQHTHYPQHTQPSTVPNRDYEPTKDYK